MATSTESRNAAAPPITSTRRISSVAYAEDEIASELKIGSARRFESRCSDSSSFASGRPTSHALARRSRRPNGVRPADAAGFATSWLGPA